MANHCSSPIKRVSISAHSHELSKYISNCNTKALLYQQLDGKKVYEGTMTALSKDELTLEYMDKTRKKTITIPRKQIAKLS